MSDAMCQSCEFTEVFHMIKEQLQSTKYMTATHKNGILAVKVRGARIEIDCSDIPCFHEKVAEMMSSYVVSQLQTLALLTDDSDIQFAVNQADVNIKAKIAKLHEMNARYELYVHVR